jgi:hypothetical protein
MSVVRASFIIFSFPEKTGLWVHSGRGSVHPRGFSEVSVRNVLQDVPPAKRVGHIKTNLPAADLLC